RARGDLRGGRSGRDCYHAGTGGGGLPLLQWPLLAAGPCRGGNQETGPVGPGGEGPRSTPVRRPTQPTPPRCPLTLRVPPGGGPGARAGRGGGGRAVAPAAGALPRGEGSLDLLDRPPRSVRRAVIQALPEVAAERLHHLRRRLAADQQPAAAAADSGDRPLR